MSGGELAGIIISGAIALLALFLVLPLVKLGRLIDESARTVRIFNTEHDPLLDEAKTTMAEANRQLKRIDQITEDVEQVTENINSLVAVFTASVGAPLTKLVGVVQGVAKALEKRRKKMSRLSWFLAGIGLGAFAVVQLRDNPKAQQAVDEIYEAAKDFGAAVADGYREREEELNKPAKRPTTPKK